MNGSFYRLQGLPMTEFVFDRLLLFDFFHSFTFLPFPFLFVCIRFFTGILMALWDFLFSPLGTFFFCSSMCDKLLSVFG